MKFIIDISEGDFYSIRSGALYAIGHDKYDCIVTDAFKQGTPYEDRPQGEWIKWSFKTFGAMGDWEYKCSKCEKVYGGEYNFCPNCGANMKGGGNA